MKTREEIIEEIEKACWFEEQLGKIGKCSIGKVALEVETTRAYKNGLLWALGDEDEVHERAKRELVVSDLAIR